ncbi:sensor histidine kinase [Tsuneonella amylolytica]|uniref:sensor histidine kinase n=1 Tax=Tsuneonella amylolytica TaxID=2338327 RepID=UPI0013C40FCA|nr:sensor histidine kinase [Tsuneonella amylolytica]
MSVLLRVFAGMWLLLLASTPALSAAPPAVVLTPGLSAPDLRPAIRYRLVAAGEQAGIPSLEGLRAVEYRSTQFGRSGEEVVGTFRLANASDEPGSWILTTGRGLVNDFSLYRSIDGGPLERIFTNRDSEALGRSLADYQAIAVPVDLGPGQSATYVFRLRDNISLWMPFAVRETGAFQRERRLNVALVAGIVGGSVMLILINALVFAGTGRREFLWLSAAELAFAFNTLYAEGYTTILWLYRWPLFAELFGEYTRSAFGLLMVQFGRSFLRTRTTHPRLDILLRGLIGLGFAVMVAATLHIAAGVFPLMAVHQFGWLYLLATSFAMLWLGILGLRRGPIFIPLFAAWTSMAIYIGYMTLAISGAFPGLPVRWHWVGPVGLFECVMASITLVLHLRALQTERLQAERRASAALLEKLALSEEAARLADDRARALLDVRARDRTIEATAHDTRHVLHALNSAVHFGRGARNAGTADLLALLEASARHLEDILASSVSSGGAERRFLALAVCDPARTVRGLGEIYAPIAERAELALEVRAAAPAAALIDEALFGRVVSNLVNNALKFTPAGRVEVDCDCDEGLLRIRVRDTGTGMAADQLCWLNDNAGHSGDADPGIGLGTGWRAIREIVSLMHGTYFIESGPTGTEVTVLFPNPVADGTTPAAITDLAALAPDVAFVDFERRADPVTGLRAIVMVADDARAQTRIASAALSEVLLVRPLCREMLDHPYVRGAAKIPAARALSTS